MSHKTVFVVFDVVVVSLLLAQTSLQLSPLLKLKKLFSLHPPLLISVVFFFLSCAIIEPLLSIFTCAYEAFNVQLTERGSHTAMGK